MKNTIKLEVEISLEDFFNSEQDRAETFRAAMQDAILEQLNQSQWVQSNIAYYIFHHLKAQVYEQELEKIQSAVRTKIDDFKEPSDWDIRNHDVYKKAVSEGLDELKPEIVDATKRKAKQFMDDDGNDYNSFYGRISDAMVSRVFDHFVSAMVEKENSK